MEKFKGITFRKRQVIHAFAAHVSLAQRRTTIGTKNAYCQILYQTFSFDL